MTKPTLITRILYAVIPRLHRDLMIASMPFPHSRSDDLSSLEIAVLLLEDRRFFKHKGVDWLSICRELWMFFTFRKHGGASTIDMQFVRTRTGYRERTLRRKLYEMLLARLIQTRMRKIDILRCYLGIVYLGSGLYGVSSAAKKIFQREVYDLSDKEAATIAAMMVYPRPLKPTSTWESKVNRRALYGLRLLEERGSQYTKYNFG